MLHIADNHLFSIQLHLKYFHSFNPYHGTIKKKKMMFFKETTADTQYANFPEFVVDCWGGSLEARNIWPTHLSRTYHPSSYFNNTNCGSTSIIKERYTLRRWESRWDFSVFFSKYYCYFRNFFQKLDAMQNETRT